MLMLPATVQRWPVIIIENYGSKESNGSNRPSAILVSHIAGLCGYFVCASINAFVIMSLVGTPDAPYILHVNPQEVLSLIAGSRSTPLI